MKKLQILLLVISAVCSFYNGFARPVARFHSIKAQSETWETQYQLAYQMYRQRRYEEAVKPALKAAELNPNDYRAQALLGYIHYAQTKLKSASDAFAKAITLNPRSKQLYMMKAECDRFRNAPDAAIETLQKAIEIDPTYAEAHAYIGDLLQFDEKRYDQAVRAYRTALQLNPKLVKVYGELGDLYYRMQNLPEAESTYKQGMLADPAKMAGRFEYGRILVKLNRLTEARALWEGRTSDIDRTMPNFIVILERAERLQRAKAAFDQDQKNPDRIADYGLALMDGDSWVVDDRHKRAIEIFKQAQAINPQHVKAQYGICKAYIEMSKTFERYDKDIKREMKILRGLSPDLAKELEAFQKNAPGGIPGGIVHDPNQ